MPPYRPLAPSPSSSEEGEDAIHQAKMTRRKRDRRLKLGRGDHDDKAPPRAPDSLFSLLIGETHRAIPEDRELGCTSNPFLEIRVALEAAAFLQSVVPRLWIRPLQKTSTRRRGSAPARGNIGFLRRVPINASELNDTPLKLHVRSRRQSLLPALPFVASTLSPCSYARPPSLFPPRSFCSSLCAFGWLVAPRMWLSPWHVLYTRRICALPLLVVRPPFPVPRSLFSFLLHIAHDGLCKPPRPIDVHSALWIEMRRVLGLCDLAQALLLVFRDLARVFHSTRYSDIRNTLVPPHPPAPKIQRRTRAQLPASEMNFMWACSLWELPSSFAAPHLVIRELRNESKVNLEHGTANGLSQGTTRRGRSSKLGYSLCQLSSERDGPFAEVQDLCEDDCSDDVKDEDLSSNELPQEVVHEGSTLDPSPTWGSFPPLDTAELEPSRNWKIIMGAQFTLILALSVREIKRDCMPESASDFVLFGRGCYTSQGPSYPSHHKYHTQTEWTDGMQTVDRRRRRARRACDD
ncbi:hypothetical protein DFH09DRAFT_1397958 [Mycena vulgaris]|nr:hypothetical protein DFH09DRAFT_1397958 [Mycena vulgaris]